MTPMMARARARVRARVIPHAMKQLASSTCATVAACAMFGAIVGAGASAGVEECYELRARCAAVAFDIDAFDQSVRELCVVVMGVARRAGVANVSAAYQRRCSAVWEAPAGFLEAFSSATVCGAG